MRIAAYLLATALLCSCASPDLVTGPDSDAPDTSARSFTRVTTHGSYAEALASWRRPADVNAWIAAVFQYDTERAITLSESQRAQGRAPQILEPAALYDRPRGVCVDLARFGVETLRRIAPETKPKYLMLEFNPAQLRGQVLRWHWVAVYEDQEGIHVFADSKRPGHIAGPYSTVGQFVTEYAAYRNREIVTYRELDSFQRKTKSRAKRQRNDA